MSSWGYSKRKRRAYPKGSTARAIARGSSMSGVRRRRGPPREILDLSKEDKVRVEGAKDLGMIAAERNPVVRTVKDAYDVADALEKIRTGENKSLLKKLRER